MDNIKKIKSGAKMYRAEMGYNGFLYPDYTKLVEVSDEPVMGYQLPYITGNRSDVAIFSNYYGFFFVDKSDIQT